MNDRYTDRHIPANYALDITLFTQSLTDCAPLIRPAAIASDIDGAIKLHYYYYLLASVVDVPVGSKKINEQTKV